MTTTTDRTDALVERLFGATLGALELFSVYLGAELGLYRALERHGAMTPDELAHRAGIAPALRPRVARAAGRRRPAGGRRHRDAALPPRARPRARARRSRRRGARRAVRAHARRHRRRAAGGRSGLPDRQRRAVRVLRRRVPPRPGPHQPARLHARAPHRLDRRHARHPRTPARPAAAASPTSAAAKASRPSPSPRRSRTRRSTASTSTPPRSPTPPATPPKPAWTAASASCTPTPPSSPDRTT